MLETRRNERDGICGEVHELSQFAPNQVALEEMRMNQFEQGLKGEIKQIIVWVTKSLIAQELHGTVGVALRDPEWESS